MIKFKKALALSVAVAMCLGTFVGCSNDSKGEDTPNTSNEQNQSGDKTPDEKQEFTFSSPDAVLGLNPIINTTGPDNGLHDLILETLVRDVANAEGNSEIQPAVAQSWEVSEDGTVYTFKIRDNAQWNDGVPVTANDFVFTYKMMATPSTGSTNAWLFDGIIKNFNEALYNGGNPEEVGVKAIDEKTVEFTLVKPCGYFLDLLCGAKPVRQDKYEEWGDSYGSAYDKVVMNGAFVIESWNQNVQMSLIKNEKYWNAENVKLDRVNRKVIKDTATSVQALLSGEIDVIGTNDQDWQKVITEDGRFKKLTYPNHGPEFFGFNCANKYFKNPKIRLAFSLSIDREKLNNDVNNGQCTPLYSMMPSVTNVGDKLYSERVEGKNEIIKTLQEKYPDPKALLIEGLKEEGLDPDPSKMDVTYATRGTDEFSKKLAEWLLQTWEEELGVRIKIDMMEWNIMWDKVDAGEYDICAAGWGPYYNDPNALLCLYDPVDGYFNSKKSGWTGPDADRFHELLVQASNETDDQKRAELFLEAEEILVGTGIIIPTYVYNFNTFLADYVEDYFVTPHSGTDYTKIYTSGKNK